MKSIKIVHVVEDSEYKRQESDLAPDLEIYLDTMCKAVYSENI